MATEPRPAPGTILWRDLTVPDAGRLRDFYTHVVGWRAEEFEGDFNMFAPGSKEPVAGICHTAGPNRNLPAHWLIYITVDGLDDAVQRATARGATLVDGPRKAGPGRIAVIRDPAGAYAALSESK